MVESLITLLIVLAVVGVIWWVGSLVLAQIPSPLPLQTIWSVIMALVLLIILLRFLLPLAGVKALG